MSKKDGTSRSANCMASDRALRLARAAARSPAVSRLLSAVERIVFGGALRERILVGLLLALADSKFRRAWRWAGHRHHPHFSDHAVTWLKAGFGTQPGGVIAFIRGYYTLELIRPGDVLLDIGCGDGFFARRFYAPLCAHVDAIDIDETAIQVAVRSNKGSNVSYHKIDVCNEAFPLAKYDVVVCDGAIGHISADCGSTLLSRVAGVLGNNGVFCGSESLGTEGHDHLQFFDSAEDLRRTLRPYFKYVQVKEVEYRIGSNRTYLRREGFWRCSNSVDRLESSAWS